MISAIFPIIFFFWMRNPIVGHNNSFFGTIMGHNINRGFFFGWPENILFLEQHGACGPQ